MKRWLVLGFLAAVGGGCRESMEGRFIYYPSRTVAADPGDVGLAFRDVTFVAADGVGLHAWLIPGPARTVLLYSHGNAGNIGDRVTIAKLLVEHLGVAVFMYDYRGYGRSGGEPSEQGLRRDAIAARAALLAEGFAPDDVVYFGRSLGAAVTLDLALAHPPPAVVLEAPFASVRAMANTVLPGAGYLFGDRWNSLAKIGGLRAPLLVFHGDADTVVPLAQGRALFDVAPEPKTFVTIRGGRHYDLEAGWSEYWAAWHTFLSARPAPAVR
jgi:uncharacterized protein